MPALIAEVSPETAEGDTWSCREKIMSFCFLGEGDGFRLKVLIENVDRRDTKLFLKLHSHQSAFCVQFIAYSTSERLRRSHRPCYFPNLNNFLVDFLLYLLKSLSCLLSMYFVVYTLLTEIISMGL